MKPADQPGVGAVLWVRLGDSSMLRCNILTCFYPVDDKNANSATAAHHQTSRFFV